MPDVEYQESFQNTLKIPSSSSNSRTVFFCAITEKANTDLGRF